MRTIFFIRFKRKEKRKILRRNNKSNITKICRVSSAYRWVPAMVVGCVQESLIHCPANIVFTQFIIIQKMLQTIRLSFDPEFITVFWIFANEIRCCVAWRAEWRWIVRVSNRSHCFILKTPSKEIVPTCKTIVWIFKVDFVRIQEISAHIL